MGEKSQSEINFSERVLIKSFVREVDLLSNTSGWQSQRAGLARSHWLAGSLDTCWHSWATRSGFANKKLDTDN